MAEREEISVKCLTCDEVVIKIVIPSKGQVSHCSSAMRYIASDDDGVLSVDVWIHSKEAYDPTPVYASPTLSLAEKEVGLKSLAVKLNHLEREYRHVIVARIHQTQDLLSKVRRSMLAVVVADGAAKKTDAFKSLRYDWNTAGINKVWCIYLLAWAQKNRGDLDISLVEHDLRDINLAVKFAVENDLDVPEHLNHLKGVCSVWFE